MQLVQRDRHGQEWDRLETFRLYTLDFNRYKTHNVSAINFRVNFCRLRCSFKTIGLLENLNYSKFSWNDVKQSTDLVFSIVIGTYSTPLLAERRLEYVKSPHHLHQNMCQKYKIQFTILLHKSVKMNTHSLLGRRETKKNFWISQESNKKHPFLPI